MCIIMQENENKKVQFVKKKYFKNEICISPNLLTKDFKKKKQIFKQAVI